MHQFEAGSGNVPQQGRADPHEPETAVDLACGRQQYERQDALGRDQQLLELDVLRGLGRGLNLQRRIPPEAEHRKQ